MGGNAARWVGAAGWDMALRHLPRRSPAAASVSPRAALGRCLAMSPGATKPGQTAPRGITDVLGGDFPNPVAAPTAIRLPG